MFRRVAETVGLLPLAREVRARIRFRLDFRRFRQLAGASARFPVEWRDRWPFLRDRDGLAGFDRHYFYHVAWAARVLAETRPSHHTDISSHLPFIATLSAFMPVSFYEFVTPRIELQNLTVGRADLCSLPFADGTIGSLSCMHVIEHVGLGRYGDPLDPDGDLKAMKELQRVLGPGGHLLFVVPVGRPCLRFNAQRTYAARDVVAAFAALRLREFAWISGQDGATVGLVRHADINAADQERNACGCFWFEKPQRDVL